MPLVRIDLLEGQEPETIELLHERCAAVVADTLNIPPEMIRTYVTEFQAKSWGIAGVSVQASTSAGAPLGSR